ncbi:DMT family transporter [Oceanibaculum indicum]|uniref:Small multidrug resistance transmembrane protein n=2 Tax=Oceanibaculum indicum TaxID=526216 RepID=K2J6Q3_9PROT|nr:EamA family transporter [Oceanibaculum indicum]EKE78736.1 small multidrug resistance transmembrane protein [Oceanibaculum indicum P24]RKQ72581.1 EamA-like transporter family protein [Oceanibaculum indicum]
MTLSIAALAVGILIGVAGQMLLKAGASGDTLLKQFLSPQSILGLGLYFAAAVCYMYALRKLPVSVAFPSVSLSYVIVALLAYWTMGESLGPLKLAGIAMIVGGVFLITRQA